MFDIGFWELLVIAIVLLLVMGPERLPEVARQAAFLVRKARQGMFRLRNEMQSEMDATPFADLQKARQEMTDLKNDFKQFGRELADSAEQKGQADSKPNSTSNSSATEGKGPNSDKGSADGGADQPLPDAGPDSGPATQAGDIAADDSVGKQR
ncbi:MAG: sec-independent protein translocase protein TatB [Polaribacter sp.]|jgi:sec-independent protein translocase protein TatB